MWYGRCWLAAEPMTTDTAVAFPCPICRTLMRRTRYGGGRRREPAWICPAGEAEIEKDADGRLCKKPDAIHPNSRRVWREWELQ